MPNKAYVCIALSYSLTFFLIQKVNKDNVKFTFFCNKIFQDFSKLVYIIEAPYSFLTAA